MQGELSTAILPRMPDEDKFPYDVSLLHGTGITAVLRVREIVPEEEVLVLFQDPCLMRIPHSVALENPLLPVHHEAATCDDFSSNIVAWEGHGGTGFMFEGVAETRSKLHVIGVL